MPPPPRIEVPPARIPLLVKEPPLLRANLPQQLQTADIYVNPAEIDRPIVRQAWGLHEPLQAEKESELSTQDARSQFCADWDSLQSTKQLQGLSACSIKINGVVLKGQDALLLLSLQALTAYFQTMQQVKILTADLKEPVTSKEERMRLQEKSKQLELSVQSLEEIIHLEGIQKCWSGKSKSELIDLFQSAVGIFWKNASYQQRPINCFLLDVLSAIESPQFLKQATPQMFDHIASHLIPYRWSKDAHFTLGNLQIQDKGLPFDIGKNLTFGLISLTTKSGRQEVTKYYNLLEKIYKKEGTHAAVLEIDGQIYETKAALEFLAERYLISYLAMAERYNNLYDQLKTEAEENELRVALRTARITPSSFEKLAPLREELTALKAELPALAELVFEPSIQKRWEKYANLDGQDPEKINFTLQARLLQKTPASFNEKRLARKGIQAISGKLQSGEAYFSQEVKKQQDDYWAFLHNTCDAQNLNDIFRPRALSTLDWALSATRFVSSDLLVEEELWLKDAMLSATEILKTEWAYWDKLQKFSRFVCDPQLQSKIKDVGDRSFLHSISQMLHAALQNSQTIATAMEEALDIQMSEEDYLAANLSDTVKERLEQMTVLDRKNALLKLCNLHTTSSFKETIQDSQRVLDETLIEEWDLFVQKHEKIIQAYWCSFPTPPAKTHPHSVDTHYQNRVYVPFQQRIGRYPLLWESLRKDVPPIFRDAIELAYLRIKTKTDATNTMSTAWV